MEIVLVKFQHHKLDPGKNFAKRDDLQPSQKSPVSFSVSVPKSRFDAKPMTNNSYSSAMRVCLLRGSGLTEMEIRPG